MWSNIEWLFSILGVIAGISAVLLFVIEVYRKWLWARKITWDDTLHTAKELLEIIEKSNWKPTIVLGLGRSGGIWGGWLAGNLGKLPFTVIDLKYFDEANGLRVEFFGGEEIIEVIRKLYGDTPKVLIVEGATSTGLTSSEFFRIFSVKLQNFDIKTAVLYRNPTSIAKIDFVGKHGPEPWPKKFPWHYREAYRAYLRDLLN